MTTSGIITGNLTAADFIRLALGQPRPCFAVDDASHGVPADAQHPRHFALAVGARSPVVTNKPDLAFREFGACALFSPWQSLSRGGVLSVLRVSADRQMRRVHASPVVARVKNNQPVRDRAIGKTPSEAVNSQRLGLVVQNAISSACKRSLPFMATAFHRLNAAAQGAPQAAVFHARRIWLHWSAAMFAGALRKGLILKGHSQRYIGIHASARGIF